MRPCPQALYVTVGVAVFATLLGRRGQAFVGPLGGYVKGGKASGARFRRNHSHVGRGMGASDAATGSSTASAAARRKSRIQKTMLPSIAPELTDVQTRTEIGIDTDEDADAQSVAAAEVTAGEPLENAEVSVFNADGSRKSGEQIREEFFMAALTGSERGLPVGWFLNDTVEAGADVAQVSVVWQPYGDEVTSMAGSSLLRSAVDCGALTIDQTFCLTGQCEACMAEVDGEVVLSCMVPVPDDGRTELEALVCNSDAAWDDMMV